MDKFRQVFDAAGSIKVGRFQFDNPDIDMLMVDENNYLEHLQKQPAAIAYFTALKSQCEREYDDLDRYYKYRYNEMYSDCADSLTRAGKKSNVRDIESFVHTKYESELKKMDEKLSELREQRDNVAAFLKGIEQKSFTLSGLTRMIESGLLTPRDSITEEDITEQQKRRETLNRIRNRNRENGQ